MGIGFYNLYINSTIRNKYLDDDGTGGVGETWIRLFDNIVLKVTGPEATMACQDDQLYDGLKAGIDDAVHRVHDIWDKSLTTEVWEFLLVEAKNAFNDINQVGIL